MIVGTVSADGVPTITLSIGGRDWPAVIDTGFNGDLELPETLRDILDARYVGRVTSTLDVYLVEFPFDGQIIHAEATFVSGPSILIVTHLIREYQLQIDFVHRSVQLIRYAEGLLR